MLRHAVLRYAVLCCAAACCHPTICCEAISVSPYGRHLQGIQAQYQHNIDNHPLLSAGRTYEEAASESPLKGRTVVVVGAGGAGRALAFGAAHKGAKVVIANRSACAYSILM